MTPKFTEKDVPPPGPEEIEAWRSEQKFKLRKLEAVSTFDMADDQKTYDGILRALHDLTRPQKFEVWQPFFIFSGVGQCYTKVAEYTGTVYISSVQLDTTFTDSESPEATITIVPTETGNAEEIQEEAGRVADAPGLCGVQREETEVSQDVRWDVPGVLEGGKGDTGAV